MRDHEAIDRRSLALARAVVEAIDADPEHRGLEVARSNCARWTASRRSPAIDEWRVLLTREWSEIRAALLDPGEEGQRLRQSSPFAGILSPRERWAVLARFRDDPRAA